MQGQYIFVIFFDNEDGTKRVELRVTQYHTKMIVDMLADFHRGEYLENVKKVRAAEMEKQLARAIYKGMFGHDFGLQKTNPEKETNQWSTAITEEGTKLVYETVYGYPIQRQIAMKNRRPDLFDPRVGKLIEVKTFNHSSTGTANEKVDRVARKNMGLAYPCEVILWCKMETAEKELLDPKGGSKDFLELWKKHGTTIRGFSDYLKMLNV
jgi:hypothetical protein